MEASKSHLDAHLRVPLTTRDLMGICRGRCVSTTCPGCPGGYLKATKDYYAKPDPVDPGTSGESSAHPTKTEEANSHTTWKVHPDCDTSLTRCSRCGCSSIDHEIAEGDDARARGNDAFATGELRIAVAAYSRAISIAPGDAKAYSNRAAAILQMGNNPGGALSDARRAVQIEPEWAKARARMGEALTQLGQVEEAARAYGVAARLDSQYTNVASFAAALADAKKKKLKSTRPPVPAARREPATVSKPPIQSTPSKPPISVKSTDVNQPINLQPASTSGDIATDARVVCEKLTAAVASAAAQRDAFVSEIQELEAQKKKCAKTIAALHTQMRLARHEHSHCTEKLAEEKRNKAVTSVDVWTQTSADDFCFGSENGSDVPVAEDEDDPFDHCDTQDFCKPYDDKTQGTDYENEDTNTDDEDDSDTSDDKTNETLKFFESFRAAFDADKNACDLSGDDSKSVDEKTQDEEDEEWAERWEREQWERRGVNGVHTEHEASANEEASSDGKKKKPSSYSSQFGTTSSPSTRVNTSALTKLLTASQQPHIGDKDDAGRAGGPCRVCVKRLDPKNRCYAFASLSGWKVRGDSSALAPLARASAEEAALSAKAYGCVSVSPHAFARGIAASRLESSRDGTVCARCGCDAEHHASRQDTARMLRCEDSKRDAEAEEDIKRVSRVALSAARVRNARQRGETVRETHCDAVSGAERVGCDRCGQAKCKRFTCLFSESDATDPESVLFCSLCGCAANQHPVCQEWSKQQEANEAAQASMRDRAQRAREEAARQSARRGNRATQTQRRCKDLALLGLELAANGSSNLDAHRLARAYKRAALRWHPDKQGGDSEQFVAATEAFQRLREEGALAA